MRTRSALRRSWPAALAFLLAASPALALTFTRITDASNPVVTDAFESPGAAWEDVNGDGLLDLFVPEGILSNQNDHLYINLGGGAFRSVTGGPLVSSGGTSNGGAFADWNADGIPDLFVWNRSSFGNFLWRGLGDTAFVRESGSGPDTDGADSDSSSWLDIDGDGDLDLYVMNFGGPDFLYLNSGAPSWTLSRVIPPRLGNGSESSIHGGWADFDDDGDLDLFIATGGGNDSLMVNEGGLAFTGHSLGDNRPTLGGSWGDFDNDGDLDLFAASYLNNASILYRNDGAPSWTLTPVSAAVWPALIGYAVGSAWGDLDDDGDLDLVVAQDNGLNEAVFLNSGPPSYTFTQVTSGSLVSSNGSSWGCSLADIDRDGDLDVFVANRANQQNFLFRNDGPTGSWLGVRCRGAGANRSAIGARVRVLATIAGVPRWQMQQVLPISGYNSENLELHFGLGDAAVADSLEVRWPDGTLQAFGAIAANQLVRPAQGGPVAVPSAPAPDAVRLALAGANPSRGAFRLALDLPRSTSVTLELIDVQGRVHERRSFGRLEAGAHSLQVGGAALAPGLYWARVRTDGETSAVTLAVVR